MAKSEELITQLEIAKDVGYLGATEMEPLSQQCIEVGKMLGGLIKARRRYTTRILLLGMCLGAVCSLVFLPIAQRLWPVA
jgi:hypothetical protein